MTPKVLGLDPCGFPLAASYRCPVRSWVGSVSAHLDPQLVRKCREVVVVA